MISRATLFRPAGVGANLSNAVRSGSVRSVVSVDTYCWSLRDAIDVVDILGDKVLSQVGGFWTAIAGPHRSASGERDGRKTCPSQKSVLSTTIILTC